MRVSSTLFPVLLSGALPLSLSFVVPDAATINQVFLDKPRDDSTQALDDLNKLLDDMGEKYGKKLDLLIDQVGKFEALFGDITGDDDEFEDQTVLDDAFDQAFKVREKPLIPETYEYFDAEAWVESEWNSIDSILTYSPPEMPFYEESDPEKSGYDSISSSSRDKHQDSEDQDHHHHHHGHDGHPHFPPRDPHGPHTNSTLFDLLGKSKHTTILYDIIQKDQEIADLLKDGNANVTLFAPTNEAFGRIPHGGNKLPGDVLKKILFYHMADGTHQACDLIHHNTLLTKLQEDDLGKGIHQRLRLGLSHHGPTVNFYSDIKMVDVFGKNGVIHGIDAVLVPPPSMLEVIKILPLEFSTTEAALHRTGLINELPKLPHNGLTLFAPSNKDWQKLGFKLNAFLFSDHGLKYLTAIMKYHVSPGHTLYSDAYVVSDSKDPGVLNERDDPDGLPHGFQHIDLPTMLEDRKISVDITRYSRFLSFRVNGMNSIEISDGITKNGVLHVPDHILIPPHSGKEHDTPYVQDTGEMTVEELKERLDPFIQSQYEL